MAPVVLAWQPNPTTILIKGNSQFDIKIVYEKMSNLKTNSRETEIMKHCTVDQLIAQLQELKESGISGDTEVMISSTDNSEHGGYLKRIESACRSAVAKSNFDKGWDVCKFVTNRGVEVVAIY